MKILITGAGGMLGTDLVARLGKDHPLVGTGRNAVTNSETPFFAADLSKSKAVYDLFASVRPDVVLHAAAMTDVDGCETHRFEALRDNLDATRNVMDAANRAGALVIFYSTDFVFDGHKSEPYREDDPPHPISVYGESKFLAERYLFAKGKRFVVLRTSWLFGKGGNNFPTKILKLAEIGKPFQVISDQFGNPTFTVDLAEATGKIVKFLSRQTQGAENQIYHIANEGVVSRFEFARTVLRKKNYPTELVKPISSDQAPKRPAQRPKNSALSTEKVKERLGISLRHWEEALKSFFQEEIKLTA